MADYTDDSSQDECESGPLLEALQSGLSENLTDLDKVVTLLSTTLPLLCQNYLQIFKVVEQREAVRET